MLQLIRNSSGELIAGSCKSLPAVSSVAVEALAVLEGIILASSLSLTLVEVESDASQVISALSSTKNLVVWSASPIIDKIKGLTSSFHHISWHWTCGKANWAVDYVAALASKRMFPLDWGCYGFCSLGLGI